MFTANPGSKQYGTLGLTWFYKHLTYSALYFTIVPMGRYTPPELPYFSWSGLTISHTHLLNSHPSGPPGLLWRRSQPTAVMPFHGASCVHCTLSDSCRIGLAVSISRCSTLYAAPILSTSSCPVLNCQRSPISVFRLPKKHSVTLLSLS